MPGGNTISALRYKRMNRSITKTLQRASDRVLPPNYRNEITIDWLRPFTWSERIKLFFGFTIYCRLTLYTEHKPGKWHPKPEVKVTRETDPERAAIECGPAPETYE